MPYLKIQSNEDFRNCNEIMEQATTVLAQTLNKPEKFIMVSIEQNRNMIFGRSKDPMLYCELKSIELPEGRTKEISRQLSTILSTLTGIAPARIYIEFSNAQRWMWGWNGSTFEK